MPEHMRVDAFAQLCALSIPMKAFPCPLGVEPDRVFPLRDKEGRMVIMTNIQILANPAKGRVIEVDLARFTVLSQSSIFGAKSKNLVSGIQ